MAAVEVKQQSLPQEVLLLGSAMILPFHLVETQDTVVYVLDKKASLAAIVNALFSAA